MYRICEIIETGRVIGLQKPDPGEGVLIARAGLEFPEYEATDLRERLVETIPVNQPSLAEAKVAKLAGILAAADAAAQAIKAGYSVIEQESWPKQEAEAKALLVDELAAAPLLRGIAQNRGIDLLVLRDKVLANVAQAEAASGVILGKQQALEDQVKAASTVEEVQAINASITLGG